MHEVLVFAILFCCIFDGSGSFLVKHQKRIQKGKFIYRSQGWILEFKLEGLDCIWGLGRLETPNGYRAKPWWGSPDAPEF
jgi:hypothetical protein